jgi:hypothetical protein
MSNISTIGGAALWVAVVFTLMLAALTPVSVTIPAGALPSAAGSGLITSS